VLLKSLVMIHDKRIRISEYVEAGATELLAAVREQHLEGIVGKQKDSPYQPGKRSGAWIKYRVNRGQELVIGGYTPGPHGIDAIIVGYYSDRGLTYVARIRNGFVPASRRQVVEKLRPLARAKCPFVNLPETRQTRWGEALTAEKMKKCIWVNPELVAQIEFLEWTESDHSAACQVRGVMPSYESSMRNLAKARAKGCPPRPWRSKEEAEMVRRYTFWWFTCRDRSRPSGRDWARQLGITHTWLQKLVRQFEANPDEMWQMQLAYGDPTFAQFSHAKEVSKEMKRRGELRPSYRTKYRFFY
jgi:bifunctional non-homologous end joining protein LigD